jgi:hypothetical protein
VEVWDGNPTLSNSRIGRNEVTIQQKLPAISDVLSNPSVHNRVKNWLREGLNADCVDAYYDALLLAQLLKRRMDQDLGRAGHVASQESEAA